MQNQIKIKVCGMRQAENINDLARLQPDFIGFIFYKKSSRYVGEEFDEAILNTLNPKIDRTGVFVNSSAEYIQQKVKQYGLNFVQLHGNESPKECKSLQSTAKVIKAFGVDELFDFEILNQYQGSCDYFLFDTKTPQKGGSGKKFKWEVLNQYKLNTPFFLSGGIDETDAKNILNLNNKNLFAIDINSRFETSPAYKNISKIHKFISEIKMPNQSKINKNPNNKGFYGEFGGAYVPEMLFQNVTELQENYLKIIEDESFKKEYLQLLKDYSGRPTPLYYAKRLSEKYNSHIYLKREDLNHTGAHKINNAIGQMLIAKRLGKKRIIAETGAGQHGVATATVCAMAGLECTVYMGATDIERQAPNVSRMKMLGAKVVAAESGNKTLKDATNEAIRAWINSPEETYYLIGSVVGPHPYPDMVARLQAIISTEIREQMLEKHKTEFPTRIVACVGGGSNAAGAFYHFIEHPETELVAVEAAGLGVETDETAASLHIGKKGIIHGFMTYLMQTSDGQIIEPYSISAGLDYPGIGPLFADLFDKKRLSCFAVTDDEMISHESRTRTDKT